MRAKIEPGKLTGRVSAPPSKSYAQRLLLCAALADGRSVIEGISASEDMKAALDCIEALGAAYEESGDTVTVLGRASGVSSGFPAAINSVVTFPCRESGNTLRFFIPISLCFFEKVRFTGTKRLMERGIPVYEELFAERGIEIKKQETAIDIEGRLQSGSFTVRGDISSQFITGLLFALPLLEGDSTLRVLAPVESRAYIDITIDTLQSYGITVTEEEENFFLIKGGQRFRARDIQVEGDWSNAAFLYAFQTLGHTLAIDGLHQESIQGDRACIEFFQRLEDREPVIDIAGCPDLGPVLFAVAAAKHGAFITGTRRLKIKESDRVQAMAQELKKFGVSLTVSENSVRIPDTEFKVPTEALQSHNDHRIVMALAVLLSRTGGVIEGAEAVRKTYPDFFEVMQGLGMKVSIEEEA